MALKEVKGPMGFLKYFCQDFKLSKLELFYVVGLVTVVLELPFLGNGKPLLPPTGPAWAIIIIWIVAGSSGYLVDKLHFPGALGMILGLQASGLKHIRAAALAIIFLRSGLEIDLEIFKRVGAAAIRLLLVPDICVHVIEVQQRRLGTVNFIPATVVAAASFDDAIAITGYTLFINLAVRSGGNTVRDVTYGHCPLCLVFWPGA
ncbi:hypothetical protein COCOBI_10-2800 [Coccomyxa sp. Obi]|nr:hypothetical protein COCOBI_10-2800 [Coccomyxa sp. Obi]